MDRRTSAVALVAAITLAACSPDVVVAPADPISVGRSAISANKAGKHIVLVNANGAEKLAAKVAALGGSVASYHEGAGLAIVSGLTGDAAVALAAGGIGTVVPDFQVSLEQPTSAIRDQADASELGAPSISSQSNPATGIRAFWQWNLAHIKAPAAWAVGKLGSPTVTVAILDTGIDYNYLDLDQLVDLTRSKSFMTEFVGRGDDPETPAYDSDPVVASDDALVQTHFPGRHAITDLNGHGTNVAQQVSSRALVFAGVTSRTRLIGVKVLGANGVGDGSNILRGVLWAADNGADVANMSLGGGFGKSGNGQTIATINHVFNYARKKGMMIVVAAGNAGTDLQHNGNQYATYCDAPHVVCVSAVGPATVSGDRDAPAFYTNFGKGSVDIAAPGGSGSPTVSAWPWGNGNYSWVWSLCSRHTLVIRRTTAGQDPGYIDNARPCGDPRFIFFNAYVGTSQASPHVSGLAALLIAEPAYGKGNPDAIKKQIQRSAAAIHPALGRGRIDVRAALGL